MMQIIEFLAPYAVPIIAGCAFGVAISTFWISMQLHKRVLCLESMMAAWLRNHARE